jgi:hypothetical protein
MEPTAGLEPATARLQASVIASENVCPSERVQVIMRSNHDLV